MSVDLEHSVSSAMTSAGDELLDSVVSIGDPGCPWPDPGPGSSLRWLDPGPGLGLAAAVVRHLRWPLACLDRVSPAPWHWFA